MTKDYRPYETPAFESLDELDGAGIESEFEGPRYKDACFEEPRFEGSEARFQGPRFEEQGFEEQGLESEFEGPRFEQRLEPRLEPRLERQRELGYRGAKPASRYPAPQYDEPLEIRTSASDMAFGEPQRQQAVQLPAGFEAKVARIAAKHHISAEQLMSIISFETGGTFDPATGNQAGSGAVGLIQFTPATARALGTTTAALASMDALEQLDWVDRYLSLQGGKLRPDSLDDLYMSVLYPSAVGKDPNSTLFQDPSREYRQNRGLDANEDGRVTIDEATERVRRHNTDHHYAHENTTDTPAPAQATARHAPLPAHATVPSHGPALTTPTTHAEHATDKHDDKHDENKKKRGLFHWF